MTFAHPAALWLLLLALPLVALWFLKLRRPPAAVPSLLLWRRVLEDRRANAPFQRLRRQVPLWLQLLALAGIALAAAGPALGGGARAARTALILDTSASMGARAAPGGPTRLDLARQQAQAVVDALAGGGQALLVEAGPAPRLLLPPTDDRRALRAALDSLAPHAGGCDLAGALRVAAGAARGAPVERAVLLSDGNLPAAHDSELPFPLELRLVEAAGANRGITAAAARRRSDGDWEVQVSVEEGGGAALHLTSLEVRAGDGPPRRLPLAFAGGRARAQATAPGGADLELELRLVHEGHDVLADDDLAALALPAVARVRCAVPETLAGWRRALAAQADAELVPAGAGADLVVSDRPADLAAPAAAALGLGVIPPELAELVEIDAQQGAVVVDAAPGEPLLAHVALRDVLWAARARWRPGVGEAALERAGWRVLVHAAGGPLLIGRQQPGRSDWRLLVHSDRSTLPWRLAFPLLAGNLVQTVQRARGQLEVAALPCGPAPPFAVRGPVALLGPDGARGEARPDADGALAGGELDRPGLWRLRGPFADGAGERAVGCGLLDAGETRLARVEKLAVREVGVGAGLGPTAPRPLWPWLIALAALAILAEWWWVHRAPPGRGAR